MLQGNMHDLKPAGTGIVCSAWIGQYARLRLIYGDIFPYIPEIVEKL